MAGERKRWQVKHISDEACRQASIAAKNGPLGLRTLDALVEITGAPEKVCLRKLEQMSERRLMDYGVSVATAWWDGPKERNHDDT